MPEYPLDVPNILSIHLQLSQYPILARQIRRRMREELYRRGILSREGLEAEAREKETLEELGHSVVAVESGIEGLELVKKQDFDLVFLDLKMPGMVGDDFLGQLKAIKPGLPVTVITGYPDSGMMRRALAQGPFGLMNKPFGEADIIAAVNNFLGITRRDTAEIVRVL